MPGLISFEGDASSDGLVLLGEEDDAHAALAEGLEDLVGPDAVAGLLEDRPGGCDRCGGEVEEAVAAGGDVVCEEALDLGAELGVAVAGPVQQSLAARRGRIASHGRRGRQRCQRSGVMGSFPRAGRAARHVRCRQSPSMVPTETSRTSATSGTDSPAKNRSETTSPCRSSSAISPIERLVQRHDVELASSKYWRTWSSGTR